MPKVKIKSGWGKPSGVKMLTPKSAFTPWQPGLPPSGSYDPAIDQSLDSALRGNQYLVGQQAGVQGIGGIDTGDLDVAQRRAEENFGIGLEGIGRSRGRTLSDMDLNLQRLANKQKQSFAAAGLAGGGVQQAIEARRANDMHDRSRVFEDYGNPANQGDYGNQGRDLQLGLSRGTEDRTTQAGRAQTELGAFQSGGRTSAWAQAKQNNPFLTEPMKPGNEHTVGKQTYQLARPKSGKYKGVVVKILPSGKKVPRSDMTSIY
jgi:hypothetical protein